LRFIRKEAWGYAVLLIVLCATASVAAWQTISFLHGRLSESQFNIAAAAVWLQTLGFMLIAGAFGLWAVQFAGEAESRRRIALLVTAMDYIRDGLIALDRRGRITGANPAAAALAGAEQIEKRRLREVFPALSEEDAAQLSRRDEPTEIERRALRNRRVRTLRFRSQPSRGASLVLISDVTAMHEQRTRHRQSAQLQLIGEMARGVANDFNDLLCSVSGHAALIGRLLPAEPEAAHSARAISTASEKGIVLAGHLLELARALPAEDSARSPVPHVRAAVETVTNMLSEQWSIQADIDDFPATALSGPQLEQIVVNLSLLAADSLPQPGVLTIRGGRPDSHPSLQTRGPAACVIRIAATPYASPPAPAPAAARGAAPGVIESVIRSVVEEVGGVVETQAGEQGGRTCLLQVPPAQGAAQQSDRADLPLEIAAYVNGWSVMLGAAAGDWKPLHKRLQEVGANVRRSPDVVSLLASLEQEQRFDALIVDRNLLGPDPGALLRAILKLHPESGLLVLAEQPDAIPPAVAKDVAVERGGTDANRIILSMIEARSLAVHRTSEHG